jgi:hypothetical protein
MTKHFCDHAHAHVIHMGPKTPHDLAHGYFVRGNQFPFVCHYKPGGPTVWAREVLLQDPRFRHHAETDVFHLADFVA